MASNDNTITVKPSQAAKILEVCYKIKRPVFTHGAPGIGKSDLHREAAKSLGIQIIDLRASLLDPVDLRGLPAVQDGRSIWAQPDFLPREGAGILFADELNRGSTYVQNAFFQLILDRQLGEYTLPDGWVVFAAGNREGKDGGGITPMSPALSNRFLHLNLDTDLDDWLQWAVTSDIAPVVIAFMRYKPTLLYSYNPGDVAYPTPRSWEFVSDIAKEENPQDIEMAMVAGAVGHGPAVEFMAFLRLFRSLPNIDRIIEDPDNATVPQDIATLYAVTSALAARAKLDNFKNILRYLDRVTPEYAVFAVKDAVLRDNALQNVPEFTKWAIANASLIR